jgi:hypothetical protein
MKSAVKHQEGDAEPATVPQLLRRLGVENEPLGRQWGPLTKWLAENQATPQLWRSLVRNGYGLELEQQVRAFERPIPYRRICSAPGGKANLLL